VKRVILGIGWFNIINFLLNFIGGAIVGLSVGFTKTPISGAEAGIKFNQQYGVIILVVSIILAIVGTATGILPYTKKESSNKA
jgi:hypothetical protein